MTDKINIANLPELDMAKYLTDDEAIANYLTIVLEENHPAELAHALGTIARARGMPQIAKDAGVILVKPLILASVLDLRQSINLC